MRIGELAALVGVSVRAVRHYHHLGLLPEPERLSNGYRRYELADAVVLARIRRLAELGLSLDEIQDALADEKGHELREVLVELDADLARQQEAIGAQRTRLAALLAGYDLHPDLVVGDDLADVLRSVHVEGSPAADADRELLALIDTTADPDVASGFAAMLRPLAEPETAARVHDLYRRLDELADAEPTDPRVPALAADIAAQLPEDLAAATRDASADDWLSAVTRELAPAPAEVVRLLVRRLREGT